MYANPTLVTDPVGEAGTLAPILGLPRADVMAALRTAGTTFVYVDRGVPVDVATHVSDLALPGIGVLPVGAAHTTRAGRSPPRSSA